MHFSREDLLEESGRDKGFDCYIIKKNANVARDELYGKIV